MKPGENHGRKPICTSYSWILTRYLTPTIIYIFDMGYQNTVVIMESWGYDLEFYIISF